MKDINPEFCKDATNVYRTEHFIVRQCVGIQHDQEENTVVFSHDTYFARTLKRDFEYELYFRNRKNREGKRLPTTMYARVYVD